MSIVEYCDKQRQNYHNSKIIDFLSFILAESSPLIIAAEQHWSDHENLHCKKSMRFTCRFWSQAGVVKKINYLINISKLLIQCFSTRVPQNPEVFQFFTLFPVKATYRDILIIQVETWKRLKNTALVDFFHWLFPLSH